MPVSTMLTFGRQLKYLVSLVAILFICSCSISTRIDYETSEGALGDKFFKEIKNNKTDTDWLMANLGEPLSAQLLESNASVYTWQLSRSEYKHASLLIIFRSNTVAREKEYLHVVSVDGTVKKHWLDRNSLIQDYKLQDYRVPD